MERLGFEYVELPAGTRVKIADGFHITSFPQNTDTAAVIEAGDKVILNQNDTLLSKTSVSEINTKFPKIHAWFFQFSLAGYYGNEDRPGLLKAAHDFHLKLVSQYFDYFKPDIFVPFASYVYFCKPGNSYLNRYRVAPEKALQSVPPGKSQLLWTGDLLLWENWQNRTQENLKKWETVWQAGEILAADEADPDAVLVEARKYLSDLGSSIPFFLMPRQLSIRLRESGRIFDIYPWKKEAALRTPGSSFADAEVGDDDLLFFFKFPWGADTLNITGNLKINSQFRWRWFAYLKHCRYVFLNHRPIVQGAIAIAGAVMNSLKYYASRTRHP